MLITSTCAYCGETFTWDRRGTKTKQFCNRQCYGASLRATPDDFWRQVDKTDGCWYWRGALNEDGYGVMTYRGRQVRAHRLAYDLTHATPLGELKGCHTCDNPRCVRPDHIFPGTTNDNVQDMIQKGRARYATGDARQRAGEHNGRAKLTEQNVRDIRQRRAAGSCSAQELAHEYGVSWSQVYRIIRGEFWTQVGDGDVGI